MAYNTSQLQRKLDAWRRQFGREVDEKDQRFTSPMGFEHINFNGVIVFPFDHYRTQLLAPRWGIRGRRSRVVQPIRSGSAEPYTLGTSHVTIGK
jgi:Tn3 transposase DDE domain-containing protein